MKEGSLLQDLSTGVVGITGKVSEDYFNFSYLQHFSLPYIGGSLVGTICESSCPQRFEYVWQKGVGSL